MGREGGMAAWFFAPWCRDGLGSALAWCTLSRGRTGIATLVITQRGTELEQRATSALASTRTLGSLFRWIGVLEMTVTYTVK